MEQYTQTELLFDNIRGKKVAVDFEGGAMSADGGVLLLRQVEGRAGVIDSLSSCLPDRRRTGSVVHGLRELLTQRVLQIACGYPTGQACKELRSDPAMKCGCDRRPFTDGDLASQPTMSRLENSVSRTDLYRMALAMLDSFLDSYKKPPRRITLDFDETCDPTHGAQQLSLFHAYYDTHCFLPLHVYEATTGRLVTALLRPGRTPKGREIAAILKRLIPHIRRRWPRVQIIIRGDSHYGAPEVHDVCEEENVWYILGVGTNRKLQDMAFRSWWELVRDELGTYRCFTELQYQAGTWRKPRRVIVRIHATSQGVDLRFVVTNMPQRNSGYLYDKVYAYRGQMENLIKDHKNALRSDLTSCSSFVANTFRVMLHSAAYVLLHHLREKVLAGTELATAQFDTLRLRLLKVGARIVEKSHIIRFHLPTTYAYRRLFIQAHREVLAGQ